MKGGLELSNLEKVFWPDEGYAKGDVIEFYYAIATTILPYLVDRPMVLNRHPNGIAGQSFFQKQVDAHIPQFIETVDVKHTHKLVRYLMVNDIESLLYVANLGCIELNPFHARIPHLDKPSYMVFDLDPEEISFDAVIEVAKSIHDLLCEIGIESYLKTSGGRGLHIYIPLGAQYNFFESEQFCHLVAMIIQSRHKTLVSLARLPKKRQGRVYIDFLRNSIHQTVVSAYSIRPKPFAPVSAPLLWEELKSGLNPLDFTIKTMPLRIDKMGDIFAPVLGKGIDLRKALKLISSW